MRQCNEVLNAIKTKQNDMPQMPRQCAGHRMRNRRNFDALISKSRFISGMVRGLVSPALAGFMVVGMAALRRW